MAVFFMPKLMVVSKYIKMGEVVLKYKFSIESKICIQYFINNEGFAKSEAFVKCYLNFYFFLTLTAILRLAARPSSVSLVAAGCCSP